ncbi:MAG: hypothetical protein ACLUHE_13190 [Christensenellales bacterium]
MVDLGATSNTRAPAKKKRMWMETTTRQAADAQMRNEDTWRGDSAHG